MTRSPLPVGPIARPDAKQPHANPIRRFREELRLTRQEFCDLTGFNVDSLRIWETTGRPNGTAAVAMVEMAKRNHYPLTLDDIYQSGTVPKNIPYKLSAKRKRVAS